MRPRHAVSMLVLSGIVLALVACGSGGSASSSDTGSGDDTSGGGPGSSTVEASLSRAYKFDAEGSLSLSDLSELPVAPDQVVARWYTYQGWYVAVFEGLNLNESGAVCLTSNILDASTGTVSHNSGAPTDDGVCDDAGAGQLFLASESTGVRSCAGSVALISLIPADVSGVLGSTIMTFAGDGTGVAVSGEVEVTAGEVPEIDKSEIDCGPLPPPRVMREPTPLPTETPTAVPASEGNIAAANRTPAPTPRPVDKCVAAAAGVLQDVVSTPAGPYFIHHPEIAGDDVATVIFLAGGSGQYGSAQRAWEIFFNEGNGAEQFRVVFPYVFDGAFIDDAGRTLAIVNEVLWCYGGDPASVHLAGSSNGGLAAFAVMSSRPEMFATLLGAPGAFPVQNALDVDPRVWIDLLGGRAVFNGVGVHDAEWKAEVVTTHNALATAGVESVYVEFPGQGHIPGPSFDPAPLFEFWASH